MTTHRPRFSALLRPPRARALRIGDRIVVHELIGQPQRSTYVVLDAGTPVARYDSWRQLCHDCGWQLCPLAACREPDSWPESAMTAWQRACFYLARRDIETNIRIYGSMETPTHEIEPIPAVHPDCAADPPPKTIACPNYDPRPSLPARLAPAFASTCRSRSSSASDTSDSAGSRPPSTLPPSGSLRPGGASSTAGSLPDATPSTTSRCSPDQLKLF